MPVGVLEPKTDPNPVLAARGGDLSLLPLW